MPGRGKGGRLRDIELFRAGISEKSKQCRDFPTKKVVRVQEKQVL
jgi:hypothetical protein